MPPAWAVVLAAGTVGGCVVYSRRSAILPEPEPEPEPQPEPEPEPEMRPAPPPREDDPWSDESEEEQPTLDPLPVDAMPSLISDGPFTIGIAVQRDRSRLREFTTHGRRSGWFGSVVLLAPESGGGQELLVLAAQKWQAPDSSELLAALCSYLQDEGAAFLSVEQEATVHVSPLPPFSEDGVEEEHVAGRLGLTVETPLTASTVDVATDVDVLTSTAVLVGLVQRFLEARSIALFETEAAASRG
jgi:hypothetical protein